MNWKSEFNSSITELEARGLPVRPDCYLGDEWFSPEGSPVIAIPFYLAHPRLKQLELHQMLEVEGGTYEWCMQILRHECGHAYDHAYQFSSTDAWVEVFGDRDVEYQPETYRPRPYSKSFVRHLPNWYAQAHPDEDFAETFAVWLALPAGRVAFAISRLESPEEARVCGCNDGVCSLASARRSQRAPPLGRVAFAADAREVLRREA